MYDLLLLIAIIVIAYVTYVVWCNVLSNVLSNVMGELSGYFKYLKTLTGGYDNNTTNINNLTNTTTDHPNIIHTEREHYLPISQLLTDFMHSIGKQSVITESMVAEGEAGKEYSFVYVNKDVNNIAGFITAEPAGSNLYISNLLVNPQYRGMGIGTKLLQFVVNLAIEDGFESIELEVNKKNPYFSVAKELYIKNGFKEVSKGESNNGSNGSDKGKGNGREVSNTILMRYMR